VKAADPDFDDQDFLTIVRETFERVRHARSQDDLERTDAALSPELEAQLKTVVAGDLASHRHHLLPGLEIRSAQIQSTEVVDGKIQIAVGLHLRSEEVDLDDAGKVVAGDYTDRDWDEVWTFVRDPRIDTRAFDAALVDIPLDKGGWLFAHKGWIVTSITRLGAADPLDPSNL
jgi:predicted lipid-binding transport protein (Tim44 family)